MLFSFQIQGCNKRTRAPEHMAGLEELRKKLEPLFDAEKGLSIGMSLDPGDSYMVNK